jgi:hypothetical protein
MTIILGILASVISLHGSIDRGAIQGTVTDPQGAMIPGATVVVKNVDTNVAVSLITNSAGFYLAPELVPGRYSVRIAMQGFSPLDILNISVLAGKTTIADAELKVGATSQSVEVTAAAPLVEATPSNFTTDLSTHYIQDIPLPGRDIQALVQLVPGITQSFGPSGTMFGFDSAYGAFPDPDHIVGSAIGANGGQAGANAWYLDGSLNMVLGAENVVVNPSQDATSEFNVVNNGLAAEWGLTSGAVINVVLKSGTNHVHGGIYEFNRNSYFNATNPFDRRNAQGQTFLEPRVNYNNFGGTLGGPVYVPDIYNGKGRTFFFVSYDVSTLHANKPTILTVPLPNERIGNFAGDPRFVPVCGVNGATNCLYDPYTTTGPDAAGLFHRTAFSTPVIPSSRIDPVAAFYLASYPNPNFLDPLQQGPDGCLNTCNNYLGPVGSSLTPQNVSIKIDHQVSDKHKLFGEWLFNPSNYTNFRYPWNGPTAQTQTGLEGAQPYRTVNQVIALGLTSMLTPTLVNEARANFTRQNMTPGINPDSVAGTSQTVQELKGLNLYLSPPYNTVPNVGVGGIGSFGIQSWQNALSGGEAVTILDNLTKVLSKHTLKTGMMYRRDMGWYETGFPTAVSFGGGLTADPVTGQGGAGLAQILLGAVDQGSYTGTYHSPWQSNIYWAFYGQDEFRVAPNLTLSFGLRYDVFGTPVERHNDFAIFNLTGLNPQIPFVGRIDYAATPQHPSRNLFPSHKDDLAPRLSFAWTPFGNHKTVIRGGYGIIYSNSFYTEIAPQLSGASQTGYAQFATWYGDYTGETPAFQLSQGAPALSLPDLSLVKKDDDQFIGQAVSMWQQGSKDPYVQQWSFYVQRELPANMMLSVGYVGTHGSHLIGDSYRTYDYTPTTERLALRENINLPVPTNPAIGVIYGCGTSCPAYLVDRQYPQYSSVQNLMPGDGFNRYNSLQMKFEKRYSQGLNLIVAYTLQKNIESPNLALMAAGALYPTTIGGRGLGRVGASPPSGGNEEDPDDRNRYIALAPDDIPQILNLAGTYELPFGEGKPFLNRAGAVGKIVSGWKLTQNWNFQRGVPMGFGAPCNAMSCTPNLLGDPSRGRASKSRVQRENQWFDPSAFEAPFGSNPAVIEGISTGYNPDGSPFDYNSDPYWVFGNAGREISTGRAPGFWNSDLALARDIHLTEARYFEIRWEALNAFNHQNLGMPNTGWCLPPNPDGSVDAVHIFGCQFGKITNIQTDPRAMEFGLRFYW